MGQSPSTRIRDVPFNGASHLLPSIPAACLPTAVLVQLCHQYALTVPFLVASSLFWGTSQDARTTHDALQDHSLEMLVHSSAFNTIRLVAAENRDVVPMLAISCSEDVVTNRVCISIYGESFQGNGKEPFKVDSFVRLRKTPAPHYSVRFLCCQRCFNFLIVCQPVSNAAEAVDVNLRCYHLPRVFLYSMNHSVIWTCHQWIAGHTSCSTFHASGSIMSMQLQRLLYVGIGCCSGKDGMQDERTTVNGLAASFQAACNTSSTLRMCHVLPLVLTAAPAQPEANSEAAPDGSPGAVLSGMLLQPAAPLKLTQLNRMRVLESMLSARLMQPAAYMGASGDAFRTGLLSIEQSRELVPLLHSDPMVWS